MLQLWILSHQCNVYHRGTRTGCDKGCNSNNFHQNTPAYRMSLEGRASVLAS